MNIKSHLTRGCNCIHQPGHPCDVQCPVHGTPAGRFGEITLAAPVMTSRTAERAAKVPGAEMQLPGNQASYTPAQLAGQRRAADVLDRGADPDYLGI